uniref:Uncharacterized protein n=1 Tax=Candidatus Kentrum sp. FW TaxID=2126338 RepID=A0A450T0N0_9GAMM|nr:MAG: hypothetical protein BECKFW1821B_GA0114236_10526 [Candidatus Kentron sp. FW]
MTETPPKLPVYLAALPQLQTLLRGTDITVTPGVWLGVHDLLLRLDQEGRLPPLARFGDLRALLSPLLCRNPEEQRRFKEIFRDWHIQVQAIQPDAVPGPETAEVDSGTALSGKWLQGAALPLEIKEGVAGVEWSKPLAPRGTRPWQSVVIALGILILAGLLWWGITRSPEEAIENQTETSLTEKSEEKSPQQEKLKTPDTVSTEISDTDASEQGLEPLPPRESPTLDPATHRDLDIIGVFLPWLPFLLALAGLGGYGWRHRRRIARQKRISEAESLYTAPPKGSTPSGYLRLEPPRNDLFGALPVQTALRRLHRPVLYPTRHLDTHATVRESVRRAGLFFPVYWERLRVPRLIVLVENRYAADPVTGLGALVVERLRAAGFIVHRYDYRGSPRAVWEIGKKPEESGGRHTLVDIAYRYPNSRLLLIGDPTTLLDPRGERVKTWVSEFGIWPDRAILGTRQDTGGWKKILEDTGFAVAPLGSSGLMELGARFSGGDPIDTKDRDTPLPEALHHPPPRWLQPMPPDARELARLLRILRRFLGDSGFYLLAAIAVHPRLHWGLVRIMEYSLFPGAKDDPGPEPFDREARLLRLVQLPWFPRGWLPDWLRKSLIHDLDADRRGRINKIYKELIYREAKQGRPPEGTEDIPIGPIVEPPPRGRLAGAIAGVLLLAGVLGTGIWGLWHGTPWWEWNLRSKSEGFLLERQIAANGKHLFAIIGDENSPELAGALQSTLREFGFSEIQEQLEPDIAVELTKSADMQHQILFGPGADPEAAKEIARRLAWLTHRQPGTIAKTVSTSIPEGMIVARLAADPQADPGVFFADDTVRDLSFQEKETFIRPPTPAEKDADPGPSSLWPENPKPSELPESSMGFVAVIDSSLKYYGNADLSAKIEGNASSDFGRSLDVVNEINFEGRKWLKIEHPRFKQVWLIDDGNKILKPGSGTQKVEAQKTEQSKLFKKGLVRNHGRQDGNQTSVVYYDSPNLSGTPLGSSSTFEVRYIFKATNKAVLLGRVERAHSSNAKDVLVGWIDKENIIEWNNRIGVEFNKGNWEERKRCGVGKIYSTERDARKRKGHVFEEGKGNEGLPHYAYRYPLLDTNPRQGIYKIAYIIGNAVEKGFVHEKDKCGNDLIEFKFLVERNVLEGLKVGMYLLSDTVRDFDNSSESIDRFEEVVTKVVRALTGDKIERDDEIAEFIEKRKTLPIRTGFLKRSPQELIDFSRDPNNRERFVKYLLERVIRLEQVIREQNMELERWDSEDMEWLYNPGDKRIPYFFSLEQPLPKRGKLEMDYSKRRHAWVPLEYFP